MLMRGGARAPVRFLILFVFMAGVPLAILGLAAWRSLAHDREMESEQLQKRLESAAGD